jgi:hypothetical protein
MTWRVPLSILFVLTLTLVLRAQMAGRYSAESVLQPAPVQPVGHYDAFGKLLTPEQAWQLVLQNGLNPFDPNSYLKLGLVHITSTLIARGQSIFLERAIGDSFGLQRVFGFSIGFARIVPDMLRAISDLNGKPTTNLRIVLSRPLTIGSRTFPVGATLNTGLDVEAGAGFPLGIRLDGSPTCAVCHVTLDSAGNRLLGAANSDVNAPLIIALAPNTAAAFARLSLNPLDPVYAGHRQIIDSKGQLITLPDPVKFERAFDDAVMDVPAGHFESSPDGINDTTKIPNVFTFGAFPYLVDGIFSAGPFGGLSAITNAVHSSEVNLLVASQLSRETIGIDPEVYLGVALQNAADPSVRLPEGPPVRPSQWLRQVAPNPYQAELEDQVIAPGAGTIPNLKPSLFTLNGLVFSPNSGTLELGSGQFLFAADAMAAFQNSLVPPPNRSEENRQALLNGSVNRGAIVFQQAGCTSCHAGAFYTDNRIHSNEDIRSNPARAHSHLALDGLLVPPAIYSLDTPVPPPPGATVLALPTTNISPTPTSLPFGLLPNGGYKTPTLRGLYLSAPYLHDGGVAVRAGSLKVNGDGSFVVVEPKGLGLSGTLAMGLNAHAASSLRALLDRTLRQQVVTANRNVPGLVRSNLDGTGHDFYVDPAAGFSYAQQADLVNFLLALDDDPAQF